MRGTRSLIRSRVRSATHPLIRCRAASGAPLKSTGSSGAPKKVAVSSRKAFSKVYVFSPNSRLAMASTTGRFGSWSDACSLPADAMTSRGAPSRWSTLRISSAVGPTAPPHVMARAVVMLAGE